MSDPRNPVVQTGNDKYIYGTVTWAEPVEHDERKLLRSNAGRDVQNWECKGLEIAANMKLITYEFESLPRAGVVVDCWILDVAALLRERGWLRDVRALLELPNDPLTRLKSALSSARSTQVYR